MAGGELTEALAIDRRAVLTRVSRHWHRLAVDAEVAERARRAFPVEPVRTPDALHLASALRSRGAMADLGVLSLDVLP